MRFATTIEPDGTRTAVLVHARGVAPLATLLPGSNGDLMDFIASGRLDEVAVAAERADSSAFVRESGVRYGAPYLHPRMIWGIGLNYRDHANDLEAPLPEEPASFIKADHTIIGPGDPIPLPVQSERVTAEAEVGLIIGRYCRNVEEADALDYVFGLVTILDQTAEDILQRNPRFLTRSKNFPGFFSFGPQVVTMDEAVPSGDIGDLEVSTMVNGELHRKNTVNNMTYSPRHLVSFHSKVMPLYPGDIISTGTPGAVVIRAGDVAECRIPGFVALTNPVVAG
jgi:2-keto-4-pentenoate hydratase/2-oxohepta-3-ene-1,7-dioic acid hydratase in catechol pathway